MHISPLRYGLRCAALSLSLLALPVTAFSTAKAETQVKDVLKNYADIAHAGYEDALISARNLRAAIKVFIAQPNDQTQSAAKAAWFSARIPYQQTEAYRFGNQVVDDWEGKVNAWPLDEGLIDYVSPHYGTQSDENNLYAANVIANKHLKISGRKIDVRKITKKLIADTLHEAGDIEANVATGYHAIEFLLWGQDLNGTGPGAGKRPPSDYDQKKCSNGNCARRAAYLLTATELLLDDLVWITAQWSPNGAARKELMKSGEAGLSRIFTGIGSLSYGELAGERMQLGLMVHDPEEEHDCFSDNTHNSHFFDALGIRNVYLGRYRRIDGRIVSGASVSDLVKAKSAQTDTDLRARLDETMTAM